MAQERVPPKSKDLSLSWTPAANTKASQAPTDEVTLIKPEASKSSSRLNQLLNNTAFVEIGNFINNFLEMFGLKDNRVTANGAPLGGRLDKPTNQTLRIEGDAGGSRPNISITRFSNVEEVKSLEVIYREPLEQNSKLAEQFSKIRGRAETSTRIRNEALTSSDDKKLQQAEKLFRDVASDAARLENKLVEAGLVRNGVRYKPEPELLGNNKHGLEWEGGQKRLMETGNPQGKFGSLADIKFATEKAAELGLSKEGFFNLPQVNSSFVYLYKDGIIGGDIITVSAKRVYIKVRRNGVYHAYPLE